MAENKRRPKAQQSGPRRSARSQQNSSYNGAGYAVNSGVRAAYEVADHHIRDGYDSARRHYGRDYGRDYGRYSNGSRSTYPNGTPLGPNALSDMFSQWMNLWMTGPMRMFDPTQFMRMFPFPNAMGAFMPFFTGGYGRYNPEAQPGDLRARYPEYYNATGQSPKRTTTSVEVKSSRRVCVDVDVDPIAFGAQLTTDGLSPSDGDGEQIHDVILRSRGDRLFVSIQIADDTPDGTYVSNVYEQGRGRDFRVGYVRVIVHKD